MCIAFSRIVSPASVGRRQQRGFTLVELSVVLVVIGLIIGAVSIGKDVQRNAQYQRIASDFVQGWAIAYDRFYDGTGVPPGDTPATPTGRVNAGGGALCGDALRAAMQAAGVEMPAGRTAGAEERYVYLDSNGNPQQMQVCFQSVAWSEPDAVPGNYVSRQRNVMTLSNLTPALATLLDNTFDAQVDARFGRLREQAQANNITTGYVGAAWSVDERMRFGDVAATARDEAQVAVVNAYLKMTR